MKRRIANKPDLLAEELKNFEEIAEFIRPYADELPKLRGIDIAGFSMPLRAKIGGDHTLYLDFKSRYDLKSRTKAAREAGQTEIAENLEALSHRVGILVADVSGHRMTDFLIGAMLHQAFMLGVLYELDLSGEVTTRLFEQINTRFHQTTATNKYFTMIYGEITDGGTFRFISAGHSPPALFSREFERFLPISRDRLSSFPPVGMFPSSGHPDFAKEPEMDDYKPKYEVNEINLLARGDILLLHTDGLAEYGGGEYYNSGIEKTLTRMGDNTAEEIAKQIRKDLPRWGKADDDVSCVVIRKGT